MSWVAFDVRGFLGDVGTAHGWAALAETLRRTGVPSLVEFAERGYTEHPQKLAMALTTVPDAEGKDNLRALALKAAGVLIVSDGVVEDEDDGARLFNEIVQDYETDDKGNKGVWRTIRGRKVFIREGETASDAVNRSLLGKQQWTTEDDVVVGDWAWPNASPKGMDYDRLRNPKTEEGKKFLDVLNKLPVYDGVTYRGLSVEIEDEVRKFFENTVKINLQSSSSKDISTALMFMDAAAAGGGKNLLLEFRGRGADISGKLPEDLRYIKEVVIRAGSVYKWGGLTLNIDDSGNEYTHVLLKEVRP